MVKERTTGLSESYIPVEIKEQYYYLIIKYMQIKISGCRDCPMANFLDMSTLGYQCSIKAKEVKNSEANVEFRKRIDTYVEEQKEWGGYRPDQEFEKEIEEFLEYVPALIIGGFNPITPDWCPIKTEDVIIKF